MKGYQWDEERGMAAINPSPEACDTPSPDELKHWQATGEVPYTEELDRCPGCGRAEECACKDCRYCVEGVPHPEKWTAAEQKRWGVGPYKPGSAAMEE